MSEDEESQDQQPEHIKEEVTVDVERSCDNCFYQDDSDGECYNHQQTDCYGPPPPKGEKSYNLWKSRVKTRKPQYSVDGEKASSFIGRAIEADAEEKEDCEQYDSCEDLDLCPCQHYHSIKDPYPRLSTSDKPIKDPQQLSKGEKELDYTCPQCGEDNWEWNIDEELECNSCGYLSDNKARVKDPPPVKASSIKDASYPQKVDSLEAGEKEEEKKCYCDRLDHKICNHCKRELALVYPSNPNFQIKEEDPPPVKAGEIDFVESEWGDVLRKLGEEDVSLIGMAKEADDNEKED